MKLFQTFLFATLASGISASALWAADYYVAPVKPGPVAGAPLAAISLQAAKSGASRLQTNVGQAGNTTAKWIVVGAVTPSPSTSALTALQLTAATVTPPSSSNTYKSLAALDAAGVLTSGDHVYLQDGYHGDLVINGMHFTSDVTIEPAPGATAQVDTIDVRDASHLVIKGLKAWPLVPDPNAVAVVRTYADASDITFANLDVRSLPTAVNFVQWNLAAWNTNKISGFLMDGTRITATGNRVTGVYHGVQSFGAYGLIENNIVDGFAADGMRAMGDNSVVRGNKVQNCFQIDSNHADGFQSWSRGANGAPGAGTLHNLRIERNKILEWTLKATNPLRCHLQGIGMFDGIYEDVTIANNVIAVGAYHGIAVAGANRLLITQNTVAEIDGKIVNYPWIKVNKDKSGTPPTNVTVANNSTASLQVFANTTRNIVVSNNTVVKAPAREYASIAAQDFDLLPGAISANAGTKTYATPADIAGAARPKGVAPDAGAYENY